MMIGEWRSAAGGEAGTRKIEDCLRTFWLFINLSSFTWSDCVLLFVVVDFCLVAFFFLVPCPFLSASCCSFHSITLYCMLCSSPEKKIYSHTHSQIAVRRFISLSFRLLFLFHSSPFSSHWCHKTL